MLKTSIQTALLTTALLAGSATGSLAERAPPASPGRAISGDTSPSGEKHPGEVVFEDKIEKRTYSQPARQLSLSSAWVKVGETWKAVVRTEITGTPERRTFTKYGADGKVLERKEVVPPRHPLPPT